MKSIIIFRHGSANAAVEYERDYDRTLTPRGVKDAEKMGHYLSGKNMKPDLLLSSSAIRAKKTAEAAHAAGDWKSNFFLEPKIYGGSPYFLLELIKEQDNHHNSICLVGHEPNFSRFIIETSCLSHFYFPTAAMAKIDFKVQSFSEIEFNIGTLDWVIRPKDLNI